MDLKIILLILSIVVCINFEAILFHDIKIYYYTVSEITHIYSGRLVRDLVLYSIVLFVIFSLIYIPLSRSFRNYISRVRFPVSSVILVLFNLLVIFLFFFSLNFPFFKLNAASHLKLRRLHPIYGPVCLPNYSEGKNFHIDSRGYRNDEVATKKAAGVFRILIIGDSTLFGAGCRQEQTLGYQLEKLLHRKFPSRKFESINAAIPGTCTYQGLYQLETGLLDLNPDLVIIGYNNDQHQDTKHPMGYFKGSFPFETIDFLWKHSEFFRIAFESFSMMTPPQKPASNFEIWIPPNLPDQFEYTRSVPKEEYDKNYSRMIDLARAKGAGVLLISMPELVLPDNEKGYVKLSAEYRQIIKKAAHEKGALFVDFKKLWKSPGEALFLHDLYHLSGKGQAQLAKDVFNALVDSDMMKR